MQAIEKKCQGGLLIVMMWLATASTSLFAEKSGFHRLLLADSQIIFHMGFDMDASYDLFIFHPLPHPGYSFYSPCYPFVTCVVFHQYRLIMKRKQRLQRLRERNRQRASESSFIGRIGRQHTASCQINENEILPGFRDYGQIRPEYRDSGDYLPEFAGKGTSAVGK